MIKKTLAFLVLLYFLAIVRMLTWDAVFTGDDVLPYDSDPYFRLREVQLIAHHFPNPAPEDRYVLGVEKTTDTTVTRKEPWLHPSMFLMASAFAGGSTEDASLRTGAMFVPIVWALFTALAAFWLTWLLADSFAAFIATIYAGFCMPILWRTSLGALDNHMTESLLFLVLLLIAIAFNRLPKKPKSRILVTVLLGMAMTLCALLSYWTALGAALLCVSYSLSLVLFANRTPEHTTPIRLQAMAMAGCMLIAGGLNLLLANYFAALCLAGCGAYLLAQTAVWHYVPKFRIIVWAALLLTGLGGLYVVAPGLTGQLLATGRVALHLSQDQGFTERFYSTISETQPIPLNTLHIQYSLLFLVTPVLVMVMARKAWKNCDPARITLCVMFIFLTLVSIPNKRFSHMAAAVMAPLIGWGLSGLLDFLFQRIPGFSRKKKISSPSSPCHCEDSPTKQSRHSANPISILSRFLRFSVKTLVITLMILGFLPYVLNNLNIRKTQPGISAPLRETFQWMKNNTPRSENFWNPVDEPPYRVMAKWDVGWWMLDRAQCVPVANNAGEGALEELTFFFNSTPEAAYDLLQKQHAKYVLAHATEGIASKAFRILQLMPESILDKQDVPENKDAVIQRYRATQHANLYVYDGSFHTETDTEYPALQHYRLLYETKDLADSPLGKYPAVKFFEVVPGAHIIGKTAPGTPVTATLPLETNTGRAFTYTDKTSADAEGTFHFTFPYPTDTSSGETKPTGRWTLELAGQTTELELFSESITSGETLFLKANL